MKTYDLFLGHDPNDALHKWHEWHLQAYVVMKSRQMGFVVHGDQNGASKSRASAGMAKATGMLAGWPDLCFILPDGPLWVELKMGTKKPSKEQKDLHEIMELAGCRIFVVNADCPEECWNKVEYIIK